MLKWLFLPAVIVEDLLDGLTEQEENDLWYVAVGFAWALIFALC